MTAYLEGGPENPAFANEIATQYVNEEDGVTRLVRGFIFLSDHLLRTNAKLPQQAAGLDDQPSPAAMLRTVAETFANKDDDQA